jgi:hypothetical protein
LPIKIGVDRAGAQRGGAHAHHPTGMADGLRHGQQGVLGHRIADRCTASVALGVGRGDVDTRPWPVLREMRQRGRISRKGALTLTAQRSRQDLPRCPARNRPCADAGIVDQRIDLPEMRNRAFDPGL